MKSKSQGRKQLPPLSESSFGYRLARARNDREKLERNRDQLMTEPIMTPEETDQYFELFDCEDINENKEILFKQHKTGSKEYLQTEFGKTKYSDPKGFLNFYAKLHKANEFTRKGVTSLSTPSFNLIKASKKYRIAANPIAIIKRQGEDSKMEVNSYRLGDSYLSCLSSSLQVANHITEMNLGNNRLTDTSIIPFLNGLEKNPALTKRLLLLNLSYNKIGKSGSEAIASFTSCYDCSLEHLNLEGNSLGNKNTMRIVDSASNRLNEKLRYINLGANNIDDNIAFNIANLIKKCELLQVVIVFHNHFKNFGAALIMSEIKRHTRMKVLDFSWNLIGKNLTSDLPSYDGLIRDQKDPNGSRNYFNALLNELLTTMEHKKPSILNAKVGPVKEQVSPFAKELCELFHFCDTEMIHLDISYNNIGETDAKQISQDVKANHTILGLHVDGNEMEIDELGFISPLSKTVYQKNHFANSQIFYRIGDDHPLIKSNILNVKKIRGKNNCWICEGWKEIKFHYKPHNFEGDLNATEVKLQLNFENYKPFDTIFRQDGFVCHRMCPPGNLNFYFTMNGVPVENYGQMTHELKDAIVHTQVIAQEYEDEDSDDEKPEPKQFIITKVAQTQVAINPEVISATGYLKMIKYCEPRPEKKINLKKRPRTPWTFPISIWAYYGYLYEGDSESLLNEAFEYDFKRGQYTKEKELAEAQVADFKQLLRSHYRKIIDSYKNLSAYLGWKIWQIGQNSICEFAGACPGLLDQKYLINDVLVKVTEVKSNLLDKEDKKKTQNIPDNIIRHQWMLLLVKISKDKYLRTKIISSFSESVKYSFDTHFTNFINQFDNHKWRTERYYNEYTDNVIKAFIPVLDAVFMSQAPQKIVGRKDSCWMWLEEFTNVATVLMDAEFPVKEIPVIFNLSMKLQVNEIDFERHYNMTFPEFLEAFSRFVDKLSPIPAGENKADWTPQLRAEQHLSAKLETIMPSVLKLITNTEYRIVKEKFPFPTRDEETGLLKYDMTNQFYLGKLPPKKRKGSAKSGDKNAPYI